MIHVVNESDESTCGPAQPFAEIKAVLFDLDGTLLDTIELILTSFRHATTTVLGEALPDAVLLKNVGVPLAVQMREFDELRAEELLAVYRAHNGEIHDEYVKCYPEVPETLHELADRGMPMGVVTSKSRLVAERGLAITGLAEMFDAVITCDDTERHKPDPEPLLSCARALGVDLRYCVYVGDSPHDVRAARAGGAVPVAVTWGVSSAADLRAEGPVAVIDRMGQLPEVLFEDSACAEPRSRPAPGPPRDTCDGSEG